MPELPEVETVMRGLQPAMENAVLTRLELRREDLRFPFPQGMSERLVGRRFTGLSRRAKYVLADSDSGDTLIMHLGMSGSFRIEVDNEAAWPGIFHHDQTRIAAHDHVVFHLEGPNGKARVVYNDPRRFGYMDLCPTSELAISRHFAGLGMEPVGNALNGESLAKVLEGKAAPLKAALLDQRVISGLGNIYVCEALWMAGLSPRRKAGTIARKGGKSTKRSEQLADSIRDVIASAIKAGGSSLRDHRQTDGSLGYFQHSFKAYDREGEACQREDCSGTIARIVQSGRSTFYCPSCQR